MNANRLLRNLISTFIIIFISTSFIFAQTVIKYPDPDEKLNKKWDWAVNQAKTKNFSDGYWIGYSIKRMMGENSHTGSFYGSRRDELKTLNELLGIEPPEGKFDNISDVDLIRKEAEKALDRIKNEKRPQRKVMKDLAVLFNYSTSSKKVIKNLKITNFSLQVDLKKLPLIWLGEEDDQESISLLRRMYSNSDGEKPQEKVLMAIAMHEDSKLVIPFLQQKFEKDRSMKIREKAAFWLGQSDEQEALDILVKAVKTETSRKVREKIVFAISQVDLEAATDQLVSLALNSEDRAVQEKAVFWLGQRDDKKALTVLTKIVNSPKYGSLCEKAVFAISQIDLEAATDELIRLAKKSKDREVREKAIFWLGQSGDERAVDAIVQLVKGR